MTPHEEIENAVSKLLAQSDLPITGVRDFKIRAIVENEKDGREWMGAVSYYSGRDFISQSLLDAPDTHDAFPNFPE